ncbi:MAG: hypothetical protein IT458_07350 [Planctomycetes bacterium]|nr:hypothetical protein [Planctomycetota bacterium]
MESIVDIRHALEARSVTTSLDSLKNKGRDRVRVIRAEQIAEMIAEAVQRAVAGSGLMTQEEVDRLIHESRREFQTVLAQRQKESAEARAALEEIDGVRAELEAAQARVRELEAELAQGGSGAANDPAQGRLIQTLMAEVAQLKASMSQPQVVVATQPVQAQAQDGNLAAAIAKLAGTLEERIDKIGRKVGVSSAVEADAVDYSRIFAKGDDKKMESNLDTMQVQQKSAGGIAGNLAKLKKLKGGS